VLVSGSGTWAQTSPTGVDTSYDRVESMRGAAITLSVDTSYDQIESKRGAITLPGPVDTSYDQIESMRGSALTDR